MFTTTSLPVTDSAAAPPAMDKSKARQRPFASVVDAFFASDRIGAALLDRNLAYIRINGVLAALNARSIGDHIGRRIAEVLPDHPDLERVLLAAFECQAPVSVFSMKGEAPAFPGYERTWIGTAHQIGANGGAPEHLLVTVEDTTSVTTAHELAEIAESRLGMALQSRRIGIFEIGMSMEDMTWNDALFDIFGLSPMPGTVSFDRLASSLGGETIDRIRREVAGQFDGSPPTRFGFDLLRGDGVQRWVEASGRTHQTMRGPRVIGVVEDVTEQHVREQGLQDIAVYKDLLLSEAHHRIKNNLALVTSLLRLEAGKISDPAGHDALANSARRVLAVAHLHDQLSRVHAGDVANLRQLLQDISESVDVNAGVARTIRLETSLMDVHVAGGLALTCGLIVNELLTNAYKYAFVGRSEGTIGLHMSRKGANVSIVVEDDGIGMLAGAGPGEGLGATLVLALTRQLRGTLERSPGKGSRFELTFPLPAVKPVAGTSAWPTDL